jgi:hypothetical protein
MSKPNGVNYPVDTRMIQKQTKNALERLDDLEATLPQIVSSFQQAVQQLQTSLNSLTEVMDAVIANVGSDKITTTMTENRTKKVEAQADQDRKALDQALLNGDVVPTEAVSEKTIVVGKEYAADGTVRFPGYIQAPFMRVDPKFQELMKGQKAGFSFDLPNGGKFEITATYDVVEKAPPAAPAPTEAPVN